MEEAYDFSQCRVQHSLHDMVVTNIYIPPSALAHSARSPIDDTKTTLRRRVNARRESACIAAEAEKHGTRGTSCIRTRAQTRHTCSWISRRKLRKSRFRLGSGLDGFLEVKHVLIQKQAQSLAHLAFRACQERASVNANMYGNFRHEARSDMFWSWRRFVRVLEEVSRKARICL